MLYVLIVNEELDEWQDAVQGWLINTMIIFYSMNMHGPPAPLIELTFKSLSNKKDHFLW